jgi:hypothetical protein
LTIIPPSIAAENDDRQEEDQLTKDRNTKEKAQKKRDKEFNEEKVYKFMVGRDVLTLPLFYVSLYVKGRLVEGKLRVAIQTSSPAAARSLNVEKMALKGIIYPLAIRMWEKGRPTTNDISNFKVDATKQLKIRYDDLIKEVFIESIL